MKEKKKDPDITERKRTEEALRESERRLTEIQRIGKIGNWEWIPAEDKVIWSAEMYAIFGIAPESVSLTTAMCIQAFHPEDRAMVVEATRKAVEELKPQLIECRILKPDGTIGYVSGRGEAVLDGNGKLVKMIGIYQDITERKRAEEALRESQKRFQALAETTNDFVWEMDASGAFTYCSPQINELWGYKPEDVIGRTPFDLMIPEDKERALRAFRATLESPSSFNGMVTRSRDSAGRIVVQETNGVPFFDVEGRLGGFRGISRDITERNLAVEELRKTTRELEEKNAELNRFIYAVSHDLKSPLVTIQTFQGHLEQDIRSQDAARLKTDLGYIRGAADKMSRLLDEIRNLSRIGRIVNPSEEAPLQVIVKEALDLVAGRIRTRGVRVDVTEEPAVLYGDRTRLVEVFQNLLDNAAKFTGDQKSPRIEIGVEQAGEELVTYVRDNGVGIGPEVQPLVFGLFHKLDPGAEGEGIGLALVKRIVELHGGRIWVESEGRGKGATFRFTLAKTKRAEGRNNPP